MTPNTLLSFAGDLRIRVPDSLDLITPYVLREQHDWFEDELTFVRHCLQPGQHAIDIGANYGVYTLSMAKSVGPSGRIWAFEPASETAHLLAQSLAANGFHHIQLEQSAVSHEPGVAHLSLNGHAELNAIVAAPLAQGRTEAVQQVTLDACLDAFAWHDIAFIKIDAEGQEANILQGGSRFLGEQSPLVQYEVKAGNDIHLDLVDQFSGLGYESYRLIPGLNLLAPFDATETPDSFLLNLFACKPDRAQQLANKGLLVERAALAAASERPADLRVLAADPRYQWRQTLGALPYGQALAQRWAHWASQVPTTQTEQLVGALALYALSTQQELPAVQRYCALSLSLRELRALCRQSSTGLRLASLARVAREFGARTEALAALQHLINTILKTKKTEPAEVFLLPERRLDTLPPGAAIGKWILAGLMEALERGCAFSSFYTGVAARPRLELIRELGFASADMQRRLALVNQRFGAG